MGIELSARVAHGSPTGNLNAKIGHDPKKVSKFLGMTPLFTQVVLENSTRD